MLYFDNGRSRCLSGKRLASWEKLKDKETYLTEFRDGVMGTTSALVGLLFCWLPTIFFASVFCNLEDRHQNEKRIVMEKQLHIPLITQTSVFSSHVQSFLRQLTPTVWINKKENNKESETIRALLLDKDGSSQFAAIQTTTLVGSILVDPMSEGGKKKRKEKKVNKTINRYTKSDRKCSRAKTQLAIDRFCCTSGTVTGC